ncbi:hypothetical protein BX286_7062 [Streptomyces sp. 3211.6]|nr:hypothetical protein BX286_7062 [Streptomyces sp. 3211.6]
MVVLCTTKGSGVLPKSKVDLYAAIRRDSRQGLSNRALQRKYGVGVLTVQKALSSAWPEPRKPLPPRATRLDPFKAVDRRDAAGGPRRAAQAAAHGEADAAIVDRLTSGGNIIETGTDSYRLATTRARAEQQAAAG